MSDITLVLNRAAQGDPKAADQLLPLVYEEMRKLAAAKLANESPGQTLQPTALVHEAWLRLVGHGPAQEWNGRGHFFGAAAEAMRRILVERARRKARIRHGGQLERVDLDSVDIASECSDDQVLAVNEALEKLAQHDAVGAKLIELRFFLGVPHGEAAKMLGLPERTATRVWAFARAWLHEELKKHL
jgi:RNA polymerase sigma factor (TIGR02999 family)